MSEMSDWVKGATLGLVQGLTEFLPISSSGHLIAFKEAMEFAAPLAFDVALHVATLAAVVYYFRRDLLALLRHSRRWKILAVVVLATIPGALMGVVLGAWRDTIDPWWVVGGWTVSSGYLLLSRGRGGDGHYERIGPGRGLVIGIAQAMAIFPGISRSGASITCGLWLDLDRDQACRFSFLISIPLIFGAGLKKGMDLLESTDVPGGWGPLLVGMGVAFTVGLLAIHVLLRIVQSGRIHQFGWYNAAAAVVFALFLLSRG